MKKSGFTLAEVLITLGIVGVLAAILIPSTIEKVQDLQFKQAAKEAFAKASQAVQQMKQDEGGSLSYYVKTPNSFKPVFINYFNVLKNCSSSSSCVPWAINSDIYSSLTGQKIHTEYMDNGQFVTSDGMFYAIENLNTYLFITVDVNSYNKGPNVIGRDTFIFQLISDTLFPMGAVNTNYPSSSYCNRSLNSKVQGFGCMDYVMRGIDY